MKRLFFMFVVFVSLFNYSFAFEVLNSNNNVGEYFSFQDNFVKIINDDNLSKVEVSFIINEVNKKLNYSFFECEDNKYCVNFFLKNIAQNEGYDFSESLEFNVKILNDEKKIYLDLVKPNLTINSINVNKSLKKINMKFNFDDDLKVKKVDLYKKNGSDLTYLSNVTLNKEFIYSVTSQGTHTFLFKIVDWAGNEFKQEISQDVGDLFSPEIKKVEILVDVNSNIKMKVDLSDNNNLKYYEVKQDNIKISEEISGKQISKEINIPFESGDVIMKVIDDEGNEITKTISLNSPINNKFESVYRNSKEFRFESNADDCYLIKVDSKTYDEGSNKFNKNKNDFYLDLNIDKNKLISVNFYCVKNNFKEYYERNFLYDTNKPVLIPKLKIEANEDGDIEIKWSESYDKESKVKYLLFRNSKEIYDGNKLKFIDKNIEYPNEYEYFVKVIDEAENYIESLKIIGKPKKIFVNFQSNLNENMKVDFSDFIIKMKTDVNSDVKVILTNNNVKLDEKNYENIQNKNLDVVLNLNEGVNQINIEIIDEFKNKYSNTFFVTYEKPILSQKKLIPEEKSIQRVQKDNINSQISQNGETRVIIGENEKRGSDESINSINNNFYNDYNWIWFGIILFVFLIFIWVFIFKEDKLYHDNRKIKKNKKVLDFNLSRKKDSVLAKSFDDIKIKRMQKQVEKQKEIERTRKLSEKQEKHTELDKKKYEDLKGRKNSELNFEKKEKKKYKKREIPNLLKSEKLKRMKNQKKNIFGFLKKKGEKFEKQDQLSIYLRKEKTKKSWHSTKDYLLSEQLRKEKKIKEKIEKERKKKEEKIKEKLERKKKIDAKEKKDFEKKQKREGRHNCGKIDLDSYLKNKMKKRNKFYFAEKLVNRDIKRKK